MAKDWTAQLSAVNFRCDECKHAWESEPDLIEDAPDLEHHPYRYFADCPKCKAQRQPQAAWARALLKAHQASTGPKTPEGMAAVRKNLEGHPNAEAVLRTRFNAMKHGMAAKTASYFPAKPDKYPFCGQCEVNRTWCAGQAACVKQAAQATRPINAFIRIFNPNKEHLVPKSKRQMLQEWWVRVTPKP